MVLGEGRGRGQQGCRAWAGWPLGRAGVQCQDAEVLAGRAGGHPPPHVPGLCGPTEVSFQAAILGAGSHRPPPSP